MIIGGSGFIGSAIAEYLSKDPAVKVVITYHCQPLPKEVTITQQKIDITHNDELTTILNEIDPTIIINCAAMSSVEECEQNPEKARALNTLPTKTIVHYCQQHPKTKYVFFSTSQVFSGNDNKPFVEDAHLNPNHVYGKTKKEAEDLIKKRLKNYAIIRPCVVYGIPKPFQHSNIVLKIIHSLKENTPFVAYTDMLRSPCYRNDLPPLVEKIITQDKTGVFHAGSEAMSMYDFAVRITKTLGKNHSLIVPKQAVQEQSIRALNTSVDITKTKKELNINFTSIEKAIKDMEVLL